MSSKQRLIGWIGLVLLVSGCVTTRIVNLTPYQVSRTPDGLYLFEARWKSNLRTIIPGSMKAYVVIGTNFFAMHRVPGTTDRWEATVPLSPTNRFVHYWYKFTYLYKAIPEPKPDSTCTPTYTLEILPSP